MVNINIHTLEIIIIKNIKVTVKLIGLALLLVRGKTFIEKKRSLRL